MLLDKYYGKLLRKLFLKKNNISLNTFLNKKTRLVFFGSCVTLDSFRSYYNEYKNDFIKQFAQQRSTIISLTHPKIPYENEDLEYVKPEDDFDGGVNCLKNDFEKKLLERLDGADYLIINLLHDVRLGVLEFEDSYITNNYTHLPKSKFYKNNQEKFRLVSMKTDEKEYFNLFKNSCELLFDYLDENYPNLKVVLQKVEITDHYISKEGKVILREDFKETKNELNPLLKKLEDYVINKCDVETIPFPENSLADENHIWGLHNTHFTKSYYRHVYNEMKIIVLENKLKELEKDFDN